MSPVWVEIERLVLDGVAGDASTGRRLATLTEQALERLLRARGILPAVTGTQQQPAEPKTMRPRPGADEARLADELAMALYRALDRTA